MVRIHHENAKYLTIILDSWSFPCMEFWNYTDYRIEGQHEQTRPKTFEQRDTKQEQVLLCNDMGLSGPEFCSLAGIIRRSQ